MEKKEALWGERHNGVLVNIEENEELFKKIFDQILKLIHDNEIHDFELCGRIKDAGMLAGKISRCQTEQDLLTTKYEELGFRIILQSNSMQDFDILKGALSLYADFTKDYVTSPRQDGLILGDDPKLCYRAFHTYTKYYSNKPIEIQIMTQKMLDGCNYLTKKYGPYWKQKDFKEKRLSIGDER
jgi:(p)ppGpp synthase/HD superfamily hydrolase